MKTIVAPGGKVRGFINEVGNQKQLISKSGRMIGYYDEVQDKTYLTGGRMYGFGDQLMALLEE
jgi:hypothetical protein